MDKSPKLKNNKIFLKFLCICSAKQRKSVINHASKDEILALTECCINILNGNVKLTDEERRRLTKHCSHIRAVSNKISILKKKRILIQKGGFLPILLAPLLSV